MESKNNNRGRFSMWMYFGVGILILLLLVWLTIADFWGDTDVNALCRFPIRRLLFCVLLWLLAR